MSSKQRESKFKVLRNLQLLLMVPLVLIQSTLLYAHEDHDSWFWGIENLTVKPTVAIDSYYGNSSNSWGNNDRELVGGKVTDWTEFAVTPGIEAEYNHATAGSFYARVSGVYSATRGGLDAAGSNIDDENSEDTTIEDAYVGWRSGEIFASLGKDAIDLSIGSQQYSVGTGFIINDGGSDGGDRGGFWVGARKAFDYTGVAKLSTGDFKAEAVYLQPDGNPDESTELAGLNLEYTFGNRGNVGVGYWNIFDSNDDRRDGLDVYNLRGDVTPFDSVTGLSFSGELVKQDNGSENDSIAGWAAVEYDFGNQFAWEPKLSYRYAHFSGDDDPDGDKNYDPLFYGSTDLGTWYLGEIAGEYVIGNSNINVHTVRLSLQPTPSVTTTLLYYFFQLDKKTNSLEARENNSRVALIDDKDLAHEVNLGLDWAVKDNLSLSALGGVLLPTDGGEDFFGGDDDWYHLQFYAGLSF